MTNPPLRDPPSGRGTTARANAQSLARLRQVALIGMGWTIVIVGVVLSPVPGPGGIPLIALGTVILMRNSRNARRLFVRVKRRSPRWAFHPFERVLRRRRR